MLDQRFFGKKQDVVVGFELRKQRVDSVAQLALEAVAINGQPGGFGGCDKTEAGGFGFGFGLNKF